MSFAAALSPVVQPVAKHRRGTSTAFSDASVCCYRTAAKTPLVCDLGTLLSDNFILCFQHLLLTNLNLCSRHLALTCLHSVFSTSCFYKPQSVFSAPCCQIPSICVFSILFLHTFSPFSRHRVLTHVLYVLSATTSQKLSVCVLRNLFSQVLKYVP